MGGEGGGEGRGKKERLTEGHRHQRARKFSVRKTSPVHSAVSQSVGAVLV
jgi:hypothetical protein